MYRFSLTINGEFDFFELQFPKTIINYINTIKT